MTRGRGAGRTSTHVGDEIGDRCNASLHFVAEWLPGEEILDMLWGDYVVESNVVTARFTTCGKVQNDWHEPRFIVHRARTWLSVLADIEAAALATSV